MRPISGAIYGRFIRAYGRDDRMGLCARQGDGGVRCGDLACQQGACATIFTDSDAQLDHLMGLAVLTENVPTQTAQLLQTPKSR